VRLEADVDALQKAVKRLYEEFGVSG